MLKINISYISIVCIFVSIPYCRTQLMHIADPVNDYHPSTWNVFTVDSTSSFRQRNPILRGGGNFVLHPKVIPITSIWVKLHKNVIRCVLEIYFPSFFQQNQNYQQVTWTPYGIIMEFTMNSTVKLPQNQKCCNFELICKDEILPRSIL